MIRGSSDIVDRTHAFWSQKLGREVPEDEAAEKVLGARESLSGELRQQVSDNEVGKAIECETDQTDHGGTGWRLEIVRAEPQAAEPFDFEDWLATALVDYWCSTHGGARDE